MSAGTVLGALLQLALLGAVGWGLGNLVLDRITSGTEIEPIGVPERALAAFGGAILFAAGAMAAHIVLGGVVFGTPAAVPLLAVVALIATRRHLVVGGRLPWLRLAGAAAILGFLYLGPALIGGSSIRTGDPPWHLGWTQQLLHGEPVPTGPAPEFGRNGYPWGLHAVMASAVRLVPGSTPMVALEMLHVALVAGIPLAAACIARRIRDDAGWAAAAAVSLIGGFGWMTVDEPDFVATPMNARYGADLVVASPNSVYELLPPALPRELGVVMLGISLWLLMAAVRSPRRHVRFAAGASVGLVGILSVPLFVGALLWLGVAAGGVPEGSRLRWIGATGGPALLVFALWGGPVLSNAIRYGGFVNITPQLGHEWPLPVALASWGLLLPLGLGGVALALRSRSGRLQVALMASSGILLIAAVARSRFGWDLAGNATLFHQGRIWPPLHLLGAAFAGVALASLNAALSRGRRTSWAAGITGAILAVSAASPAVASYKMTELISRQTAGFEYARPDLAPGSFARRAATYLGPSDVVEVRGSDELAFVLFQLSGVRLADYDDPRLEDNDVRIRYADLARARDRKNATDGFDPTYLVLPAPEGPYDRALVRGAYDERDWILIQLEG